MSQTGNNEGGGESGSCVPVYCFGPIAPELYGGIPDGERSERVVLNGDLCVIDGKQYFIRCCLDIPIIDTPGVFRWLVWVSLSLGNFRRTVELWEIPGRETEPPYPGWLNTKLPLHRDTLLIMAHVQTQAVGERATLVLESASHPLAVELGEGITQTRAGLLAHEAAQLWS